MDHSSSKIIQNSSSFFIPDSLESKELFPNFLVLEILPPREIRRLSRISREKFRGETVLSLDPFLFAVLAQKWPRLKRFTASFGSDTSSLSRHSGSRPPVMQISRRKLKFREVTLPSRLRTRQSLLSFHYRKKKKTLSFEAILHEYLSRFDLLTLMQILDIGEEEQYS